MGAVRRASAAAVILTFAAAGCSGETDSTPPTTTSQSTGQSPSRPPSQSASAPSGGTSDSPRAVKASTRLLDWTPVEAATGDTVTMTAGTTVTLDQSRQHVSLTGSGPDRVLRAPRRFQFSDVITDGTWLVAVAQDKQESRPSRATVIQLESGKKTVLDGDSDIPTINGGSWAVGNDTVLHPTYRGTKYCLASVDLTDMTSTAGYCAPRRGGFSQVLISPSATSLLTFSGQPQCRTVAQLDGTEIVPFAGVTDCKGWDGAVTADGAIWSVVRNENRVEQGEFLAATGGGYVDLGVGTTGSLTWCGDSAYFVRDSQTDKDKARLLRWTPEGTLEVAYESPGTGEAFLATPRCAGDVLSISAFGEGGDEQVWAKVP